MAMICIGNDVRSQATECSPTKTSTEPNSGIDSYQTLLVNIGSRKPQHAIIFASPHNDVNCMTRPLFPIQVVYTAK